MGDLDSSAAVFVDYNVDKDIVREAGYRASLGNIIDITFKYMRRDVG